LDPIKAVVVAVAVVVVDAIWRRALTLPPSFSLSYSLSQKKDQPCFGPLLTLSFFTTVKMYFYNLYRAKFVKLKNPEFLQTV